MTIFASPASAADLELVGDVLRQHLGPREVRLAVVAMSRDDNPKAVVVATPVGARVPALAVKVALTPAAAESVRTEAVGLERLRDLDPGLVDGTVPRLVAVHEASTCTLLVTTVAPGRPLSVDYHRWHHCARPRAVGADFDAASAWLTRLHPVLVPPAPEPDIGDALLARWPGEGVAEMAAEVCRRARDRLGDLDAAHVVHGDFWCGNILRSGPRVTGVVDWEHVRFGAAPLWDRVRFALAYTLYLDRHTAPGARVHGHGDLRAGAWGDPVRHLLAGGGWYAERVGEFITSALGPAPSTTTWRDALLVGLGDVAASSDQPEFARAHLRLLAEARS